MEIESNKKRSLRTLAWLYLAGFVAVLVSGGAVIHARGGGFEVLPRDQWAVRVAPAYRHLQVNRAVDIYTFIHYEVDIGPFAVYIK